MKIFFSAKARGNNTTKANLAQINDRVRFESMYPIPGKSIPMDEYYYSVADYLNRKKGVQIFIGFRDNILYPKLPAYFG